MRPLNLFALLLATIQLPVIAAPNSNDDLEKAWACGPSSYPKALDNRDVGSLPLVMMEALYLPKCGNAIELRKVLFNEYFTFTLKLQQYNGYKKQGQEILALQNASYSEFNTFYDTYKQQLATEGYKLSMVMNDSAFQSELKSRSENKKQEATRQESARQQASTERQAALQAGKVKPATLQEAAIYYNATYGGTLASAPKIRPDGKLYSLHGKIQLPENGKATFLANVSASSDNDYLAGALRKSAGMSAESTDYFSVVIPNGMSNYYFDNAQIGGGFDVVGKYVANITYQTVAGQTKQAPVFEAVYFDLWNAKHQ